ncbi:GDP-mannose 4,6-dehydratase [Curtobacterium sp. SP.BCp]|uniref:GDP-mannose 4,6-dehydratase n=1 Tax=Curtobacterium sp. SP.BCp TaxID=3435230 RepID=UPI003F735BD1
MSSRIGTALITGVTGQTGSFLAELLLERGWDVHGVHHDDRARDSGPVLPGVRMHRADLTDFRRVRAIVEATDPTTVFNLAALSSVALSWERPVETAMLNGAAAANLLACVDGLPPIIGGRGFVQASSAEIFGAPAVAPQDERTPLAPINPYGASKAYAHALVGAYRSKGLRASSVILYNHESHRRPETFVTRKITAGVARIARGLQSEIVLGNLDVRRDWGWAPDYADALRLVGEGDVADDYVVATGESHSIRDFAVAAFRRAALADGVERLRSDPRFFRPADSFELRGDATKIRDALGWRPTKSFVDVVAAMVDHDLQSEEVLGGVSR